LNFEIFEVGVIKSLAMIVSKLFPVGPIVMDKGIHSSFSFSYREPKPTIFHTALKYQHQLQFFCAAARAANFFFKNTNFFLSTAKLPMKYFYNQGQES